MCSTSAFRGPRAYIRSGSPSCRLRSGRLRALQGTDDRAPRHNGGVASSPAERRLGNLIRYEPGDPRARAAGRRGAEVTNGHRRAAEAAIAQQLEELVAEHLERIGELFEEVLSLRPDPAWKDSTKLDFLTRQISQVEKLLNRVQGRPMGRLRASPEEGATSIAQEVAKLPSPLVRELLFGALSRSNALRAAEAREDEVGDGQPAADLPSSGVPSPGDCAAPLQQ